MGRLVRRVLSLLALWTAIYLGTTLPQPSSGLPGNSASSLDVPCVTLLRTRFTEPARSPWPLVVSYTTVSPLPRAEAQGGLFSVALSRGLPRVGVTHRPALWSPDVPRHRGLRRARMTRPSCRPIPSSSLQASGAAPVPDRRRTCAGRVGQMPDSSVRTRMAPQSGQKTMSSAGAARTSSRSLPVRVMVQPLQVRARSSDAALPRPATRRFS